MACSETFLRPCMAGSAARSCHDHSECGSYLERVAKLHRGYRVPSSLPDFLSMVAAFGFFQP
jgi:hypothetical protein